MNETKSLCIVVPYRNRETHLAEFLPHMHSTLKSRNIDYHILIVEQTYDKPFNRAKLLNVGFHVTKGIYDNYCMHDVDMLPVESIDYSYCDSPTHLAAHAEQFGWNTPYPEYFGGVTMFDKESFVKINGYSNEYFGWGAEDDDMFRRCVKHGIKPRRKACRFRSLSHERNIVQEQYGKNVNLLQGWENRALTDGLNSLEYKVLDKIESENFTQVKVEI